MYHHKTRDLRRKEPLTVTEGRAASGRRAKIAFRTTWEEHDLGVPIPHERVENLPDENSDGRGDWTHQMNGETMIDEENV